MTRITKMLRCGAFVALAVGGLEANISGTVYRDFNLDGTQGTYEPGVKGLTVTAYDDSGVAATAVTDSSGHYTLGLGSGTYRVELTLPEYLNAGTATTGNTKTPVSMVSDGTTNNDIGLINAGEYCQTNPDILLARIAKEDRNDTNANVSAFLKFHYTDINEDPPTDLSLYSDLGSIYGVAHLKKANATYLSTYFKRHADIGPGGIGAIYKYDHDSGSISTFVTLPGTDPRNGAGGGYDWNHDTVAYENVGKVGIGDIDLSDDESKLFAVNLFDRKLYVIDVDKNGDASGQPACYDITNPC
jgi:hypothetical protein